MKLYQGSYTLEPLRHDQEQLRAGTAPDHDCAYIAGLALSDEALERGRPDLAAAVLQRMGPPPQTPPAAPLTEGWCDRLDAIEDTSLLLQTPGGLRDGWCLARLVRRRLQQDRLEQAHALAAGIPKDCGQARGQALLEVGMAMSRTGHKKADSVLKAAVKAPSTGDSYSVYFLGGMLEGLQELGPDHPAVGELIERLARVSQKYVKGDGNSYGVHRCLRQAARLGWVEQARKLDLVYSDHLKLANKLWLAHATGKLDELPQRLTVGDWQTGVSGLPSPDDEVLRALTETECPQVLQRVIDQCSQDPGHKKTLAVLGRALGREDLVQIARQRLGPGKSPGAPDVAAALVSLGHQEEALRVIEQAGPSYEGHTRAACIRQLLARGEVGRALDWACADPRRDALHLVASATDREHWPAVLQAGLAAKAPPGYSEGAFEHQLRCILKALADSAQRLGVEAGEALLEKALTVQRRYDLLTHLAGRLAGPMRLRCLERAP